MNNNQNSQSLSVLMEPVNDGFATLSELRLIAGQLQRTLNAVARNLSGDEDAYVSTQITGAEIGSLRLIIHPTIDVDLKEDSDGVCSTLINDINEVWHQRYRVGMTPYLLQQYRTLVNSLKSDNVRVKFEHGASSLTIDNEFRQRFQAATKERIAGRVEIVGRIEALNIHSKPFEFKLFPTLPGADYITCQFEEALLGPITDEIKRKALVRITGKGYFSPVGIFPTKMTLSEAPTSLTFNPDRLRSYIGRTKLYPPDATASEFLAANRRAAGFEEES